MSNCAVADVYSEPFPTSKMERFGKIVNSFQLILQFHYRAEAHLEPSRTSTMQLFANTFDAKKKKKMFDWVLNTPLQKIILPEDYLTRIIDKLLKG